MFASPLSLRTGEQPDKTIQDYVIQWLADGGDFARKKMGACLWWAIWKAKNVVIFKKEKLNIQFVIKEAMYWYNMEMTVGEMESIPDQSNMLESRNDTWEPPDSLKIKINFDGDAGPRGFACGTVARDSEAKFQGCKNKSLTHCKAVEAEGHGAMTAVELSRRKGFRGIILEGDSLIVINALRYTNYKPNWRIKNLINRIKEELKNFRSVEYRYIKKNANKVAHNVAALAIDNHSSDEWINSPPSCIAQLIVSEYSSTR